MKTLQEEAEEYKSKIKYAEDLPKSLHDLVKRDFIAGATSDHVHDEIIKGKIEVLEWMYLRCTTDNYMKGILLNEINELKQQLK